MKVWQAVLVNIDNGDEYRGRFRATDFGDAVEQARTEAVAQNQGTDTDDWEVAACYAYEGDTA